MTVYCSNCGEKGHESHICTKPRPKSGNIRILTGNENAPIPPGYVQITREEYEKLKNGDCPRCEEVRRQRTESQRRWRAKKKRTGRK